MSNNEVIIKGSFNGIKGELSKRVLLLAIYCIIFLITNSYKKSFYLKNKISSIFTFLVDEIMKLNFKVTLPILFIFVIFIFLAVFAFSSLLKTIKLFYNVNKRVTVDFLEGKISMVSYNFPFYKEVEEDKFDTIVTVNIQQDFMDRLFNSGKLHVDYLVISKVDSSSVSFDIPYIYNPSKTIDELLR